MPRESSEISIADRVGEAVRAYQASVDDFDREVARTLGINETDTRCLEVLLQETPEVAPSQLAERLGLTTGSVTPLLDRLERLGYLTRSPHPTDRRKTIVRATALAAERSWELIGPLLDEAERDLLTRYSIEQLELLIDFMQKARELQQRHVERLRATTPDQPSKTSPSIGQPEPIPAHTA